jgi:hypothetical protein
MKWNLSVDANLWILKPDSVNEVGCIHTCQGLETDYIGVIIGPDFVIRDGVVRTDASKRAKTDASIKGYKSLLKEDPNAAKKKADVIIKSTYRTLMTRGMKGCYLYCTDKETNSWFKQLMGRDGKAYQESAAVRRQTIEVSAEPASDRYKGLSLRLLTTNEVQPYINSVPICELDAAAGSFSKTQSPFELAEAGDQIDVGQYQWVELPDSFRIRSGLFVAKVVGESMNKRVPNGAWCLFSSRPVGTRQGKIVLVNQRSIDDPETGGHFTIKKYESEKVAAEDGGWRHQRITLKPESTDSSFRPIVLEDNNAAELVVIAELVAVLG